MNINIYLQGYNIQHVKLTSYLIRLKIIQIPREIEIFLMQQV